MKLKRWWFLRARIRAQEEIAQKITRKCKHPEKESGHPACTLFLSKQGQYPLDYQKPKYLLFSRCSHLATKHDLNVLLFHLSPLYLHENCFLSSSLHFPGLLQQAFFTGLPQSDFETL